MEEQIFTLAMTLFTVHSNIYTVSYSGNSNDNWGDKALLVGQLLWVTSVTFIRSSVLSLYIWIFRTPSFRTICYLVHVFNLAYFVAVVLACCLICQPFAYLWNQSIDGFCGDQKSLDLFIGVFNLLMDVTTVALPMPVLWGLQLGTKNKLIITGMFSMGLALVARSVRPHGENHDADIRRRICAITVARIKITTDINAHNTQQQYAIIALFTCLEGLLGVINACLPMMKPVFSKLGRATRIFTPLRTRTPTINSSSRDGIPQTSCKNKTSSREGKYPRISPPREIVHKESLQIFSPDLPIDVRAPSIPLPSFSSWRPLSRFYLSRAEWEHDPSEMKKEKGIRIATDCDMGRRPSAGDSPTLPWRPQWQSHSKDTLNRC